VFLQQARAEGKTVFIFGNGGSAATASHFAVDVIKGTLDADRVRFRIICLNDNMPTLTALANDVGYEYVFSEPLASLARAGDVAIAISGSGNSPNILRAMRTARERGMIAIGLSGATGGKLKDLVDVAVLVPSPSMQLVEDTHTVILHAIFVELCRK
jgi:D-sedoheptulose 7-phosphate isomerase